MDELRYVEKSDVMRESEFEFYRRDMDKKLEDMDREFEKMKRCYARRIKDLDERVLFIGRFMCVGLFLSVIAVVMAALF